jgi:hypothetical protein
MAPRARRNPDLKMNLVNKEERWQIVTNKNINELLDITVRVTGLV